MGVHATRLERASLLRNAQDVGRSDCHQRGWGVPESQLRVGPQHVAQLQAAQPGQRGGDQLREQGAPRVGQDAGSLLLRLAGAQQSQAVERKAGHRVGALTLRDGLHRGKHVSRVLRRTQAACTHRGRDIIVSPVRSQDTRVTHRDARCKSAFWSLVSRPGGGACGERDCLVSSSLPTSGVRLCLRDVYDRCSRPVLLGRLLRSSAGWADAQARTRAPVVLRTLLSCGLHRGRLCASAAAMLGAQARGRGGDSVTRSSLRHAYASHERDVGLAPQ